MSTIIVITPPVKPKVASNHSQEIDVPDGLSIADQLRAAADVLDGESE